jgi:hypothetical protein
MGNVIRGAVAMAIFAAAAPSLANTQPTGLRVYAQLWNPARIEGESLSTLTNQPTALSDAMMSAWGGFRSWYLAQVPATLHGSDFLHSIDSSIPKGITLYARSHDMEAPPTLTLTATPQLTLVPAGSNAFAAKFHVPGASIGVCATTPTPMGKYGDPCADLSIDLDVSFQVSLSDAPGKLLTVSKVIAAPSNFHLSDPNLPVQVLQALNSINTFFGGTDFQQMLGTLIAAQSQNLTSYVQSPVDSLNASVSSAEQKALTIINKDLTPLGVTLPSLVHVALWEQNSANAQMLTVLLALPTAGLTLDPSHQSGQINGVLTFDSSVATPPASCAGLNGTTSYADRVQTGPRQVLSIDLNGNPTYGTAPSKTLSVTFNGGPVQGRQCSYSFSNLALGLPNSITLTAAASPTTPQRLQKPMDLTAVNWGNPVVVGPNGTLVAVGAPAGSPLVGKTSALPGANAVSAAGGSGAWTSQTAKLAQNEARNSLSLLASLPPSDVAKISAASGSGTPASGSAWNSRASAVSTVSQPSANKLGTVPVPTWGVGTSSPPAAPVGTLGSPARLAPLPPNTTATTPIVTVPSALQPH